MRPHISQKTQLYANFCHPEIMYSVKLWNLVTVCACLRDHDAYYYFWFYQETEAVVVARDWGQREV